MSGPPVEYLAFMACTSPAALGGVMTKSATTTAVTEKYSTVRHKYCSIVHTLERTYHLDGKTAPTRTKVRTIMAHVATRSAVIHHGSGDAAALALESCRARAKAPRKRMQSTGQKLTA